MPRAQNVPNNLCDKRRYLMEGKGMSFGAVAMKSSVKGESEGPNSFCRAEGLMVAASRVLNDVDGSADNDEFDKIIAEHTRIVETDRHTLFLKLAGTSYTNEEITEVRRQGTRDDVGIGTSTPLDGNMWKRKLRHVLGEDVLRIRDDPIIHTRIPDWKYAARGSVEEARLMHMSCLS